MRFYVFSLIIIIVLLVNSYTLEEKSDNILIKNEKIEYKVYNSLGINLLSVLCSISSPISIIINSNLSNSKKFNKIEINYSSSSALKFIFEYISNNKKYSDTFYLEKGQNQIFKALIEPYLLGYFASSIENIKINSLKDQTYSFYLQNFILYNIDKQDNEIYIKNSRYKLGISLLYGGAISYLEDFKDNIPKLTNMVNKHDTGRLIQQSYYGILSEYPNDYSPGTFGDAFFPYNPVQGGSCLNQSSRIIDFNINQNIIEIKSQPLDWSLSEIIKGYYINKYILYDEYIQVYNDYIDFSYFKHPYRVQEMPAVYVNGYLSRFAYYNKINNKIMIVKQDSLILNLTKGKEDTESWGAMISTDKDYGIGFYCPNMNRIIYSTWVSFKLKSTHEKADYEYNSYADEINYMTFHGFIKMESEKHKSYNYLITTGSSTEIKNKFDLYGKNIINKDIKTNDSLTNIKFTNIEKVNLYIDDINDCFYEYNNELKAVKFWSRKKNGDVFFTINYDILENPIYSEDIKNVDVEYILPNGQSQENYWIMVFYRNEINDIFVAEQCSKINYPLIADNQKHIVSFKFDKDSNWKGRITALRFDFFNCPNDINDYIYITSIKLS